jgi:hypothetical protein
MQGFNTASISLLPTFATEKDSIGVHLFGVEYAVISHQEEEDHPSVDTSSDADATASDEANFFFVFFLFFFNFSRTHTQSLTYTRQHKGLKNTRA